MLGAIVNNYTQDRDDSGSYRIPIGVQVGLRFFSFFGVPRGVSGLTFPSTLQFAWAIILAVGLFFLPDSPRYFVKRGKLDKARDALVRVRGQPPTSQYIETELTEIVANAEIEARAIPTGTWYASWAACFSGSLFDPASNLRRTILGTSLQMMQQWTGVNFIFYYSFVYNISTHSSGVSAKPPERN